MKLFYNFTNALIYEKITDFCSLKSSKNQKNIKKMSILSITFHTPQHLIQEWENFQINSLEKMIENFIQVEKYILSDVQSDMINEGKNTNLLLIFDDEDLRKEFVDSELENIKHHIEKEFEQDVMIFKTFLDQRKTRM